MERRYICDPELARAFFKPQKFTEIFSPMEALDKGTIFPELYCPYKYEDRHDERRDRFEKGGPPYGQR